MRPLKLSMQAFGPYLGKQTFDFGSGSEEAALLISGPGGSGKTFLIEALFFALFGYSGPEGDNRLKGLRNIEAGPELPTEVMLIFQSGDLNYRIERRLEVKEDSSQACCSVWQSTLESLNKQEYIAIGCCEVNFKRNNTAVRHKLPALQNKLENTLNIPGCGRSGWRYCRYM